MLINEIINEMAMDTKSALMHCCHFCNQLSHVLEDGGLVSPLCLYCERNSEANINGDECG